MSPIDHASITEKKSKLRQASRNLRRLRALPKVQLQTDEILQGSVLYYLLLGIEAILDIGSHLLSEQFAVSADSYEAVLVELGEKRVVPKVLVKRNKGMAGFRNKLIHEYAEVDMRKVFAYLKHAPEEFERFDCAFSVFLQRK